MLNIVRSSIATLLFMAMIVGSDAGRALMSW